MRPRIRVVIAAALAAASVGAVPFAAAPAMAAVDQGDPGRFIDTLADTGFTALRSGRGPAAKAEFRTLLSQYFAVDQIGDRLIRRWLPQITSAQRAAYRAAFPSFIIGTYADRLTDYASADLKIVRVVPAGAGAQVFTSVTKPGQRPINAVWTVQGGPGGYKVTNMVVAGINLAVTQSSDFDSVIQSRGFDALVAMMKARG